jgi:hypothetical protein
VVAKHFKLGKAVLKSKAFGRWIESIYKTNGEELDCRTTQSMLPEYVESVVENKFTDADVHEKLKHHFLHCNDCKEVFDGLKFVVSQELVSEYSVPA